MRDEFFGEANDAERESPVKIIWPLRPLNQIEADLTNAMYTALTLVEHRAPIIWIEDDKFTNADDYGGLSACDAMTLQDFVRAEAAEPYRRQLIIARECGERATVADYVAACMAEGINPLTERLSK